MKTVLRWLFYFLLALFCFAYPFAVIGVAFNVRPPFSMDWAGSALLFIEGSVLIVAAMQFYGVLRAILVGLTLIVLSYAVEALGVNTGFPFGLYRYTPILFPRLVGGVPLAVMFAWVFIVFGAYGWVAKGKGRIGLRGALLGALLAMLLDFVIEPVAFHVVNYWQWLQSGTFNYYGVPFANFGAWFVVAFLLLLLADSLFSHTYIPIERGIVLAQRAPKLLFAASLFMFGLVDLTHGYSLAALLAIATGCLLTLLRPFPLLRKQSSFFLHQFFPPFKN
jgi:uncharacterized membrane protein